MREKSLGPGFFVPFFVTWNCHWRTCLRAVELLFAISLLFLFSSSYAQASQFETTVAPLADEDMGKDCHYALTIPAPARPVSAVWIIFDRGRDVHDLYSDAAVVAFARRFRIALLLHGHCPGKFTEDHGDMDMDPSRGLGRALFTALDQFSKTTAHPELTTAKLIFLGFSGAGPLCARLVGSSPERALAAVLSSPGHYEPMGIDTVELSPQALNVPELIIAGSADDVSGAARPYNYFQKYREIGAPWVFLVQNNSPHCCTANARDFIIHWLEAVLKQRQVPSSTKALRDMNSRNGWLVFVKTRETDTKDSFGLNTFEVVEAEIQPLHQAVPQKWKAAGWLPSHALALQWLSFVRQKQHPILPLH